jgi:predicted PurR-regulated permease PerM
MLALVGVVAGAYVLLIMISALRGVLLMLTVSLFLSFAMEPAVQFLARRGWRRGAATGGVFVVAVLLGLAVVLAMAPLVIGQVRALIISVPRSVDAIGALLADLPLGLDLEAGGELRREVFRLTEEFGDRFNNVLFGAAGNVVDLGATAIGIVLQGFTILLVTFYLVADGPKLRRTLARPLPPARQRELLAIWELAVAKTGGYIYSRLLLAIVAGVAHLVFLVLIQVPYPAALAVWVGVTTAFVPVVGTYLGGLLILVVAFVHEPVTAFWALVFMAVYQQLENYLLAPKVQAHTMNVHPAVAFTSVIIGATLLGAVGALLALPAAAIIQALLGTYVRRHELIDELAEIPLGATVEVSAAVDTKETEHG